MINGSLSSKSMRLRTTGVLLSSIPVVRLLMRDCSFLRTIDVTSVLLLPARIEAIIMKSGYLYGPIDKLWPYAGFETERAA